MTREELFEIIGEAGEKYVGMERPASRWNRLGGIAAAACLVFVCAAGLRMVVGPAKSESSAEMPGTNGSTSVTGDALNDSAADAGIQSSEQMEVILVQVERWQPEGFVGTVVGEGYSDIFPEGEQMTVWFEDNTTLILPDGSTFDYDFDDPNADDCGIPAGTVLEVGFQLYEYIPGNGMYNCAYAYHVELPEK